MTRKRILILGAILLVITAAIIVYVIQKGGNGDSIAEPQEPPEAKALATPTEASINETISFSGVNSTDLDGTISSYEWDFGDGAEASGETASHAYSAAGNFTAELTVTDNDGLLDTDEVTVMVKTETRIVEASDERITITLYKVVKGDTLPHDVAQAFSGHEFGALTEGYDYVCVYLIVSSTESVDVVKLFGHGEEMASLHNIEGDEYECLATTCYGNLLDPHNINSGMRLLGGTGLFEFPEDEKPVKLELIYSFKEDLADKKENAKRGQIDIIIPSTLVSTPT
jgi:PKD repeat protein